MVGSKPLGSVYVVLSMPSARAVLFISATNSGTLPASWAASIWAMLSPDGISSASSSCRSSSRSPARTATTDSSCLASSASARASAAVTVSVKPAPVGLSGYCLSVRYAVITLARLAVGLGSSPPADPSEPIPGTTSAACPTVGHAGAGAGPAIRTLVGNATRSTRFGGLSVITRTTTAASTMRSAAASTSGQRRRRPRRPRAAERELRRPWPEDPRRSDLTVRLTPPGDAGGSRSRRRR